MTEAHIHQSRPDIVKRLKRAEGHMRRVIAMFDEGRSCLDLAQQLHAVERAISEAKRRLIHDHVDHWTWRMAFSRPAIQARVTAASNQMPDIT
jgi:uncharacterized protein